MNSPCARLLVRRSYIIKGVSSYCGVPEFRNEDCGSYNRCNKISLLSSVFWPYLISHLSSSSFQEVPGTSTDV
jgi:hypothetical protein